MEFFFGILILINFQFDATDCSKLDFKNAFNEIYEAATEPKEINQKSRTTVLRLACDMMVLKIIFLFLLKFIKRTFSGLVGITGTIQVLKKLNIKKIIRSKIRVGRSSFEN
ncbi:hypothetical protein BpHYR1_039316 [Brachionus plicatilis]|uniref:Uncharacterized protein n=1 Tax=Brachionus plicatilis TaxID=10195 RepID=A0A3M7QQ79_BRAPC|nr:hypothetical protein BpHYR1_039316 [Brachionus plicatilis]